MKFVYLWSLIINMSFPALELHSELTLRKYQSYKNFKKCSKCTSGQKCNICGKYYTVKSSLQRHIRDKHKNYNIRSNSEKVKMDNLNTLNAFIDCSDQLEKYCVTTTLENNNKTMSTSNMPVFSTCTFVTSTTSVVITPLISTKVVADGIEDVSEDEMPAPPRQKRGTEEPQDSVSKRICTLEKKMDCLTKLFEQRLDHLESAVDSRSSEIQEYQRTTSNLILKEVKTKKTGQSTEMNKLLTSLTLLNQEVVKMLEGK